jgi:hypothetical protein
VSDQALDSYPTSESPFDSSGYVIAQFFRSLQRFLNPDNFHLASRDLSGRFAVISCSQAALVAGKNISLHRLWVAKHGQTYISLVVGVRQFQSE